MEILRLSAIAVITAFLSLLLKQNKSPFALLVSLGGGSILLLSSLPYLRDILGYGTELARAAGLDATTFGALLRVVSIALVTECAASLCRDAGESALGQKLEIAGKLMILGLSMPIISSLFSAVLSVIP